jgi:hypothetical protein
MDNLTIWIHLTRLYDNNHAPEPKFIEICQFKIATSKHLSVLIHAFPSNSPIFPTPHLLRLTPKRRRNQTIEPPKPSIRLVNMEFPIVPFILNMWFHNGSEAVCHLLPAVIIIGLMHRNVLDDYADKGSFRLWPFAAYICVVTGQVDEVDHDVEGGEADTGVECRYGFCKGGFGG